jgi:hypothetical protein
MNGLRLEFAFSLGFLNLLKNLLCLVNECLLVVTGWEEYIP